MDTLVRIYCGRNLNNPFRKEELTNEEFSLFVKDVVIPFYDCFTIHEATGFYKGQVEKTFIIEILTKSGIETESKTAQIALAYVSRYNQESVLITRQETKATLYTTEMNNAYAAILA